MQHTRFDVEKRHCRPAVPYLEKVSAPVEVQGRFARRATVKRIIQAVAVVFFACNLRSLSQAEELNDIRNKASLLPKLLQSYQFTAESNATPEHGTPIRNRITFYQSGSNLRSECEKIGNRPSAHKNELSRVISAYNGSRYQNFFDDRKTLTFSNTCRFSNPYWLPNPLIIPYLWLTDSMGMNWSDLKNQDLWAKSFSEARYEGQSREGEFACEVVSMPYLDRKAGIRVKIYFAKELAYFPIKYVGESSAGKQVLSVEVTKHKIIDSDGSRIVFPLAITMKENVPQVTVDYCTIAEESIKVNQPIDDELFTLSPSMAKIVDDYDKNIQNQKNAQNRPPLDVSSLPTPAGGHKWLLAGNVTLLVVLLSVFCYRRWRRRYS